MDIESRVTQAQETPQRDEAIQRLRQADLVVVIGLLLLSAVGILLTLRFPEFEEPTTWPGMLPVFLLIGLAIMALSMFVFVHLRDPAYRDLGSLIRRCRAGIRTRNFRRGLLILGLLAVYIYALLPALPYIVSTTIFALMTILAFRAAPWWLAVAVALVNSAALYIIFGKLYRIPLP